MKNKKGFTIMEILVVIGIIAILTVIIFPSINAIRAKGRDAERISDISTIQLALALYYSQHTTEGYPPNLEALKPTFASEDSITMPEGGPYYYVPLKKEGSNKCTFYHLGAVLESSNAQIDPLDNFTSNINDINTENEDARGYVYCADYGGLGLQPSNNVNGYHYNVHP